MTEVVTPMPPKAKVSKGKARQGVRTAKTGAKARKPLSEKEQKELSAIEEQAHEVLKTIADQLNQALNVEQLKILLKMSVRQDGQKKGKKGGFSIGEVDVGA